MKYVTDSGEIEDIRLNVVQDAQTPGAYRTAANSAVTTFSQRLSDGISLRAGDVSLRLIPAGAPSASASAVSAARRLDADTVAYTYDDKTDYEYSLTYTGFKEDIVVREYTGQTEYEFTIITNGLTLTDRDGSYYLTDGSGAVKATIGDIIIFTADERNNAFGTLTHETVRANQEYKLTIHIDPEYLLDEDTAYPIRIDPTIEITSAAGAIEDVTLNSLTGSDGDSWSLTVGKRATYGISRVLMKFPGLSLSAIPSADKITSATVELRDLMCEDESMMVYCYVFTGNTWTESTANWSNVNPNSYTDLLSSKLVSYSSGASLPTPHRYSFNITDAVKGWKTGNYTQSKGILFKTTASTENGSTYIKKTFSSYNRSSYKPSLTVNYTTGGTQTVANGTYYLNGKEGGGYLRYSSGEASAKSGLISSLGNSIRWEIQAVDGGYVLRSKSDTTKYLAVPSTSNSTLVTIETVSESTLPTRCIWTISIAAGGGCLIKNAYNGKYLYSYGTGTLSMSSTLGASGTSQYYTRVWRLPSVTGMAGKELQSSTQFYYNELMLGYTNTIKYKTTPLNALWANASDFNYSVANSNIVSVSANGVVTAKAVGETQITIIHKVTNLTFSAEVRVYPLLTNKGTLSIWSSAERDIIGYWESPPTIHKNKIGNDGSFYFNIGYNNAVAQWSDALEWSFATVAQNDADIVVHGGTRAELEVLMGDRYNYLTALTAGITFYDYNVVGYYQYQGNIKLHAKMNSATIYIPDDGRTADEYRNILTHELGHALGYIGHSASASDIMYPYVSTIYDLSTRDINHLHQLYP